MKFLLLFVGLFYCAAANAQVNLKFDKRFVECEDRWVAFQQDEDSSYAYGFIYIDAQAGLTMNYEGKFTVSREGMFVPKKLDSVGVKYRLEANQVRVALVPESKFSELKIAAAPDWLKYYKNDTGSVDRLFRWGFLYNSWDECGKALTYLERAQQVNPKYKGLEFELAFAYNALKQYEKAKSVLESALKTSPDECYLYRELSLAEMNLDDLSGAADVARTGLNICTDNEVKGEIAFNLAYQYYKRKDIDNFRNWIKQAKKWGSANDQIMENANKMEADISK